VVSGTNCHRNNIRKLSEKVPHFTRLRCPGLGVERVERVACNTNKIEVPSLTDEPMKSVDAEVKFSGDEELHDFGKCWLKSLTNGNEVIGEFAGSIEVSSSLDPQKIP
jgi:hypothetical protein